ncbi:MAG: hypothetical protein IJZ09_01940 [Tidjanibacter sp.]|nr:hypothetical protein [Tidjanibacter sp.]
MKKIVKLMGLLAVTLVVVATAISCNPEPDATDLEFSYSTFSVDEGDDGYISVYLMETPEKLPVVVDMKVEMKSGMNAEGKKLVLDDVIEFITTDQTYTVNNISDTEKEIKGVEATYTEYNKKVYFTTKPNDYLQQETITLLFTITNVEGSKLGSLDTTTLTIVDDEKAPAVKVGYYDTRYTAPADATREGKGQFYMQLHKVGKYEYVASGLFGLPRPRLVGTFNPEAKTIKFDGEDYDHRLWAEKTAEDEAPFVPINAFRNDTLWGTAYNENNIPTKVLKLHGTVVDGKEVIMMTTEEIAENAKGVILSIDTPCGYEIYPYNNSIVGPMPVGTYDSMASSESMTFGTTNYPLEVSATRALGPEDVRPFAEWQLADINR